MIRLLGQLSLALAGGLVLAEDVESGTLPDGFARWLIAYIIAFGVVDAIRIWHREQQAEHDRRIANAAELHLSAAIQEAVAKTPADWPTFGASAYIAKKPAVLRFREPVLRRIARERVPRYTIRSSVTWRPNKGIVGHAYAQERTLCEDLTDLQNMTERSHRPEDAWGLNWEEVLSLRRYSMVAAAPIVGNDDKLYGVISLDVLDPRPESAPRTASRVDIDHPDILRALENAATSIGVALTSGT